MSREDQYNVSATLNGVDLGTFDKMTGGDVDSDETKYKQGGMVPEISLGGSKTVTNITLSRLYDFDGDHQIRAALVAGVGSGTMIITKQPLDVDGNIYSSPIVYEGTLKQLTFPDHDSNSSSAGMIEMEISSAGIPA